nr:hypothetical protein [Bacteroidota bacterium]
MKKLIYSFLLYVFAFGFIGTSNAQYYFNEQAIGSAGILYSDNFNNDSHSRNAGNNENILHRFGIECNSYFNDKASEGLLVPFIANQGQVDDNVKFYAPVFGGTVFITKDGEIVYTFINTDNKRALANPGNPTNKATAGIALKEEILGSRSNTVSGEMQTQAKVNYFKGADPLKWQREIPTFDRIDFG